MGDLSSRIRVWVCSVGPGAGPWHGPRRLGFEARGEGPKVAPSEVRFPKLANTFVRTRKGWPIQSGLPPAEEALYTLPDCRTSIGRTGRSQQEGKAWKAQ